MQNDPDAVRVLAVFVIFLLAPVVLKLMGVGARRVAMINPATGQRKDGFFGFSWTYLFFGWFVPLIRGELGVAALHFLFTCITFGLWQLVVAFLYNKQYTQRLIAAGFRFDDSETRNIEAARRLGVDLGVHLRG